MPGASDAVVNVPMPLLPSVTVATVVLPSVTIAVPAGDAPLPVTATVKATGAPTKEGEPLEVSTVVLPED